MIKNQGKIVKNKYLVRGFSLLELLVALGIFSILLMITTVSLVRVLKIKMDAEARASVADNLEYTIELMKRHLLSANAAAVKCGNPDDNICIVCSSSDAEEGLCDRYKEFIYDQIQGKITFKHGSKTTLLTNSDVEIVGVTFHQVQGAEGNYIFIMLKATDRGSKIIPENQPVIVQSSVVVRNK